MRRLLWRFPIALPVAVVLLLAATWVWATRIGPQLGDTRAQAAIYGQFQPYPGAERVSSHRHEVRGDGRPTGRYELEVVYRLPDDATSAEVLDHYRRQIPDGWVEASDATCTAALATQPPPPSPAPGEPPPVRTAAGTFGLQQHASRLTVFTAGSGPVTGLYDGLTISLGRTGDGKFATFGPPVYSCGAVGPDVAALEFDRS